MARVTSRRAADALRAGLALSVLVALASGRGHTALALVFVSAAAWLPRLGGAPARLDLVFVALLAADAWATGLGAFEEVNREDRPGHLVLTGLVTPLLFFLARRLGALPPQPARRAAGRVAFAAVVAALGLALGAAWELVEWASDVVAGTDMSLGYGDTVGDLLADAVGATIGAAGLTWWLTRRDGPPAPGAGAHAGTSPP